jgi:fructokinase
MNAAIAAARLEVPSAFVGCVSTDQHGVLIWDRLVANGVNVEACQRTDAPTARAIVEHVPELRFRFEGPATADTLLSDVDLLETLGTGPQILHGGTLGLFRGQTAETLATLVEAHDGIVSLDPNVRPQIIDDPARWHHFHERWLAHTNIYKGSDEDFSWIWPERSPESCAEQLLESGIAVVLITKGAEGLTILSADGAVSVPAPVVEVVDTVGAGDTIAATVLASIWDLGCGGSVEKLAETSVVAWQEIAQRAVAAAALTCSRAGADPPFRSELDW